jgi:hypothetical protein
MTGAVQSPVFSLVDAAGGILETLNLALLGSPSFQPLTFAGSFTVPTVPFRVAANGTTAAGYTFYAQSTSLMAPMNLSVGFDPARLLLSPGASGIAALNIYNGGSTATFVVQFDDPQGLMSSSQSVSVQIPGMTSTSIPLSVTYPVNATFIGPKVTAVVSVSGDATRVGTATLAVWDTL